MANTNLNVTSVKGGGFARQIAFHSSDLLPHLIFPNPTASTFYNIQGYFNHVKAPSPMGGGTVLGHPLNLSVVAQKVYGGGIGLGDEGHGSFVATLPVYGGGLIRNASAWVGYTGKAVIAYSQIGEADFRLDQKLRGKPQEAGQSFLPWNGGVYASQKLGGVMVAYGGNGIAFMRPSGVLWGIQLVHNRGLKGANAQCGDDNVHYFIDTESKFGILTQQGPQIIDYSKWLKDLSGSVVLTLDPRNGNVHICDGNLGFIYTASGLGKGPNNITGMGQRRGTFYVSAPAAIVSDPLEVWSDIQDFGTREEKWISEVDAATEVNNPLYVSIAYRWNKAQTFFQTPWIKTDYHGRAYLTAAGVEFKIGMKLLTYGYLEMNNINIKVLIPDYAGATA